MTAPERTKYRGSEWVCCGAIIGAKIGAASITWAPLPSLRPRFLHLGRFPVLAQGWGRSHIFADGFNDLAGGQIAVRAYRIKPFKYKNVANDVMTNSGLMGNAMRENRCCFSEADCVQAIKSV